MAADFIRVRDPKTGATYNAPTGAPTEGLEVLDEPAVDIYGNQLPTTYEAPGTAGAKKGATK